MNPAMTISQAGFDAIVRRECPGPYFKPVLRAYDDAQPHVILAPGDKIKGTLTIFCGHTGPDVYIGRTGTEAEGFAVLRADLKRPIDAINESVTVPLDQDRFDSLVSFVMNTGTGAKGLSNGFVSLKNGNPSGLLTAINAARFADVPAEMMKWVWANGKVNDGLKNRRQSEIEQGKWTGGAYVASASVDAEPPPSFWRRAHLQLKTLGVGSLLTGVGAGSLHDAGTSFQALAVNSHWFGVLGLTLIVAGIVWKMRSSEA